jgi:hypothetical protein
MWHESFSKSAPLLLPRFHRDGQGSSVNNYCGHFVEVLYRSHAEIALNLTKNS